MYTFQPELLSPGPVAREGDIFERLSTSKKDETSPKLTAESDLMDPVTKQPFFRPQTGRPPKSVTSIQRNKDLPVTEQLYRWKKPDHSPPAPSYQPTQYSKTKSESLLKRRKLEQYRRLFDTLKPEESDAIRADTLQLSSLSAELIRILEPLFSELQELGEGLEFEDFAAAMDNLMDCLIPAEKALILDVGKKSQRPEEPSFRVNPYLASHKFLIQRRRNSEAWSESIRTKPGKPKGKR